MAVAASNQKPAEKISLASKLAQVVAEVEGVSKDGRNEFHKYDYATAEALLRAVRGPLAAQRVALIPSLESISEREIRTAKGGVSTITTVHVRFSFADGESEEVYECKWAGQGDDPGDKGLGKAYTNAIKTFLRETFLIPQGDDPEADKHADERAAMRVASAPQTPPQTLGAEARGRVIAAIEAAGQPVQLTLASVGAESAESLTPDHARQIRELLDKAAQ